MKRAATLLALLALAVLAPSAYGAEFGIVPGSLAITLLDAEGHPDYRAGSHPDRFQVDFALDVEGTGTSLRDFILELPPGLSGSPNAVPGCPRELFEKGEEECPAQSQVGVVSLGLSGGGVSTLPIFQLEPKPGELLSFGSVSGLDTPLTMELRPTDFGISFKANDLPEASVSETHMELWGVPADHQTAETPIPRRPFLTAPTRCEPLVVTLRARSWQEGAPWLSESADSPPLTDCGALSFRPRLGLRLDDPVADSPTGTRIELSMSEGEDPDGLASAQLKNATIELPQGFTVSPRGVVGLSACSDAEFGLGTTSKVQCPAASRVGTTEFMSPELREPLFGDVYIGQEHPGERFRLLIAAPGAGITVKFESGMKADPATGRFSTFLRNLPQVPMSRLVLNLDGGSRALLATPLGCGSFGTVGHFESYAGGPAVDSSVPVAIGPVGGGSHCEGPRFSPSLVVSRSTRVAGRPTVLSMTVGRRPGEDLTRRFTLNLPAGLSAGLGKIDTCPEPAVAAGACPAGSALGTTTAQVGSGSDPVAIHGDVYLAGPYHRAPFSLVMAFRNTIGPFDLGTMTVRAAFQVQRRSGQVSVISDALPELVDGVSIRFQTLTMALNRPGAVHNPTSCDPADVSATFESGHGASASATSAVTVKRCRRLAFKPHFSLLLAGRGQLHRDGKPSLRIASRFRRGDTNLRAMRVSLPSILKFTLSGLGEICPAADAVDGLCSPRARVGTALARSPSFGGQLKGSIYIVAPKGNGLPDLWLDLAVSGVHLGLRGQTSVRDGRSVTNLVGLPDVPISALEMRLRGGRHGVVSLAADPCIDGRAEGLGSSVFVEAQNGAHRKFRLRTKAPCAKSARR